MILFFFLYSVLLFKIFQISTSQLITFLKRNLMLVVSFFFLLPVMEAFYTEKLTFSPAKGYWYRLLLCRKVAQKDSPLVTVQKKRKKKKTTFGSEKGQGVLLLFMLGTTFFFFFLSFYYWFFCNLDNTVLHCAKLLQMVCWCGNMTFWWLYKFYRKTCYLDLDSASS